MNALLADGSAEKAFSFRFLPAFIENAKKNPVIGLRSALIHMVELIEKLWSIAWIHDSKEMTVVVDLSELVAFTSAVTSRHDFEVCLAHVKLLEHTPGECLRLFMTPKNWNRIQGSSVGFEDRLTDVKHVLRHVRNEQESLHESLRPRQPSSSSVLEQDTRQTHLSGESSAPAEDSQVSQLSAPEYFTTKILSTSEC